MTEGELVITDGLLSVSDQAIEIPAGEKSDQKSTGGESGEDSAYPDASGTNAKISENKDAEGNLLSYIVSNGTIQITNGSIAIMGIGATFKTGSFIQGQTIKSGSLKIADFDEKGQAILVANGSAITNMQGVTVVYNSQGVTKVYYATFLGGQSVNGVPNATWDYGSKYVQYYDRSEVTAANGAKYYVVAFDEKGQLVPTTSGYENASYTQKLSGTSVQGTTNATWSEGSLLKVNLNNDGSVKGTSYENASYVQKITSNIEATVEVSTDGVKTVTYNLVGTIASASITLGDKISKIFTVVGCWFTDIYLNVKYSIISSKAGTDPSVRQEMIALGTEMQKNEEKE